MGCSEGESLSSDCDLWDIADLPVGEAHEFAFVDVDVQVPAVCPVCQVFDALFHVQDDGVEVLMRCGESDVVGIDDFLYGGWEDEVRHQDVE